MVFLQVEYGLLNILQTKMFRFYFGSNGWLVGFLNYDEAKHFYRVG